MKHFTPRAAPSCPPATRRRRRGPAAAQPAPPQPQRHRLPDGRRHRGLHPYSSPGVKGRKIWGELVPYGEVWRTGANENTTITFSTPVKIDGKELPAGTYGLQTIPTQGDWTVIFSKDADALGRLRLQAGERRPAHPGEAPDGRRLPERMGFTFEDTTDTSTQVVLGWEKLRVPFPVEVDTPKLVARRSQGRHPLADPLQAANYCIQNNTCLDEAGRWIDASIALQEGFSNLRAKAMLLAKKNDTGAVAYGEKALAAAKTAPALRRPDSRRARELAGGLEVEGGRQVGGAAGEGAIR